MMIDRNNGRPSAGQVTPGETREDSRITDIPALYAVTDIPPSSIDGLSETNRTGPIRQVVFIDGSVPDAQMLARGVAPGVVAVVLSPDSNEVQQIADWLTSHKAANLAAVDIVAHGANGIVALGNTILDAGTIGQYKTQLATIGAALQPGSDIRIYGCDVAQDSAGDAFLQQISAATGGANVAAASHLVGAPSGGGSWNLDVNTGAVSAAAPFTAAAITAYPDELGLTTNQLFVAFSPGLDNSFTRIEQIGVSGASVSTSGTVISDSANDYLQAPIGLAIDAPLNEYFVSDFAFPSATDGILKGSLSGGAPTTIYSQPDVNDYLIGGVALDQPNGNLYFGLGSDAATTGGISAPGIYKINIANNAVTPVATTANGSVFLPGQISLDLGDGLVFFVDTDGSNQTINNVDVANTANGSITVLTSQLSQTVKSELSISNANEATLQGIAVDSAAHTLFFTAEDTGQGAGAGNPADAFIFKAPFSVSNGQVTITSVSAIYTGTVAKEPLGIVLDTQNNIFYVGSDNTSGSGDVYEGSMTPVAGAPLTLAYTEEPGSSSGSPDYGLALLSTPTVVATGGLSYIQNASAVTLDSGSTVSNADGQNLAGATISVSGGSSADGDTLAATTVAGITESYNPSTETLTLSGNATPANYRQVLDSVTFQSTGAVAGTRTLDWAVTDGVITSAAATSTVTVHDVPIVTAGTTVSFTGGGAAVKLDSGLMLADSSSSTLANATVTIGNFVAGDTLTVGTTGGLATSFSNGTLTLSGNASIATYQAALESVSYNFGVAGGDPTVGDTETTRTISWTVNDGVVSSTAASSTLDVVHAPPVVSASASVIYPENAAPLVLDTALTTSDPDSGGTLTGATVAISSGFLPGDTLTWTSQAGITGQYDAATGVLSLTGSAPVATYQTLLQSVAYSFAGDPTNRLADNSRTIDWTVTDGTGSSTAAISSLSVLCFCAGTLIATPDGEVAVERLAAGDKVVTANGAVRPIVWVGVGRQLVTRGKRSAATPVIVARNALGPNLPHQDLHVTRAHGLFIDDVLIPVEFLVNHRSIRWDDRAHEVALYHIELETHDVLLANGALAESYRDDGNRWLFQNASAGWGLPPQAPCAPVLTGGPVVDAVWRRLLDLAGPHTVPELTENPDLHLLVDGRRIDFKAWRGRHFLFELPGPPDSVRIMSRAAVPAELGLMRDPRRLGVSLKEITLDWGTDLMKVEAADSRFTDGFHAYEPDEGLRWTNGDAALPKVLFAGFDGRVEVVLHLAATAWYPVGATTLQRDAA